MITVLVSTAYKAASAAWKERDKEAAKSLPITATLYIHSHDGYLLFTPFRWDRHERAMATQPIPARINSDFAACIPAKPLIDWLRASQLTPTEKKQGKHEQITLTLDDGFVRVSAGNSQAWFKYLDAQEFPLS